MKERKAEKEGREIKVRNKKKKQDRHEERERKIGKEMLIRKMTL